MRTTIWAVLLIAMCAGSLCAQGMTEEYRRERERARFARPHGFGFEADLFCYAPFFDQQQKVRAHGIPGDTLGYREDFDGVPFGAFLDLDLRARFTWWDSIELGYEFFILREFKRFEEPTSFNGTIYPTDADGDYGADFHDFHFLYRRDLFRVGPASELAVFFQVGIQWAVIKATVNSDDVPAIDKRGTEHFRELLPWHVAGAGIEWTLGEQFRLRADGFGMYINTLPTLQKRDGESVRQAVVSITGRALFEWRPIRFFALLFGAQYRYMRVRLTAGYRQDNFVWTSVGPEVGVGFRF